MREFTARYRGTWLGVVWTFLNPLFLMATYTLIFSVYFQSGINDYVVHLCSGLLPWIWFSSSLLDASSSIVSGGNLIKKVVFPAEVLPIVSVLTNLMTFLMSLPLLMLFGIAFHRPVGMAIIALPLVLGIQFLLSSGLAFIFSALCVCYRDVKHVLGNALTLWFFLTPITYPIEQIPVPFRLILRLNPMALLVEAYQDIFYRQCFPNITHLAFVAVVAIFGCVLGSVIFHHYRDSFAAEI